jgi:hypothetical protein
LGRILGDVFPNSSGQPGLGVTYVKRTCASGHHCHLGRVCFEPLVFLGLEAKPFPRCR